MLGAYSKQPMPERPQIVDACTKARSVIEFAEHYGRDNYLQSNT